MIKSEADKEALTKKIKTGGLSKAEESALLDEFMGVEKKTPQKLEIEGIWDNIRANPEVREVAVKLISIIKRQVDGSATKEQVNKHRKVYNAVLAAIKE